MQSKKVDRYHGSITPLKDNVIDADFIDLGNGKALIPYKPEKKRGHRPKVGGKESKGTILKAIRLPIEIWNKILRKIGKGGDFSAYVRSLINDDLKK
jgi:hypothetical protein